MVQWKKPARRRLTIREAKKIPATVAKNYRKMLNREYADDGKFDSDNGKKQVKIPHINVLTPDQDDIIAVGPQLIHGDEIVQKIEEPVAFNQVPKCLIIPKPLNKLCYRKRLIY